MSCISFVPHQYCRFMKLSICLSVLSSLTLLFVSIQVRQSAFSISRYLWSHLETVDGWYFSEVALLKIRSSYFVHSWLILNILSCFCILNFISCNDKRFCYDSFVFGRPLSSSLSLTYPLPTSVHRTCKMFTHRQFFSTCCNPPGTRRKESFLSKLELLTLRPSW